MGTHGKDDRSEGRILEQLFFSIFANNYFINWSIATDRILGRKERNVQYLGYKKDTVLDCDLLEGICDINCCTDKDCTDEQINLFSCSAAKEESYLDICGLQEDLAPFFECVNLNSPYIGEFYINKKKIQKIDTFKNEIKMQRKKHYNYAQDHHYNIMENSARGYKYGLPLRTVSSTVDNNIVPRRIENLKLPDNVLQVFDGVCSDYSVFFLMNRNSRCVRQISKNLCEQSTNFFLSRYLVFDASSNVSSKYSFPQLLSNVSELHPVQTSVKYICLNNGSSYITILQNNFKKMTIHHRTHVDNNQDVDECEGDVETLMKTFYNDTSDTCHNVLVEVYYTFIWNGSNILKMDANYLLATVPSVYKSSELDSETDKSQKEDNTSQHSSPNIGVPSIYVTQKFHVQFIHTEQITVKNETSKESLLIRSGKPGYNIDSDIFIIDLVHAGNSSSSYEENVLQLWKTECPSTINVKNNGRCLELGTFLLALQNLKHTLCLIASEHYETSSIA
ncbi:Uncharacterized protein GBIM_15956 [Gryllus bimaculatus]|nr:Uncharacterized protein GBIM_15956 [Gryllus bimaculatus]